MSHALLLAACILAQVAQPLTADPPAASPAPKEIAAAIEQLGDDDFATRERATQFLFKCGDEAKAELEKAAKSSNAEIALRAAGVLARLKAAAQPAPQPPGVPTAVPPGFVPPPAIRMILPPGAFPAPADPFGGPPAIPAPVRAPVVVRPAPPPVDLVAEFRKAESYGRSSIVMRMREPGELKTVIELVAKEPASPARQAMENQIANHLVVLAGQHNGQGRADEALKLLELMEQEPRMQTARHVLLIGRGDMQGRIHALQESLAAHSEPGGWRKLAQLQYAAGQWKLARESAQKGEAYDLDCLIAAADGDWPAALAAHESSWKEQEPTPRQLATWVVLACHAADEEALEEAVPALLRSIRKNPETLSAAIEALLIAEQYDAVGELLTQSCPGAACDFWHRRGDPEKAFQLWKADASDELDAFWFQSLGHTLVTSSFALSRLAQAERLIALFEEAGRQGDAERVVELLRANTQLGRDPTYAGPALISSELMLGRRKAAVAAAVELIENDPLLFRTQPRGAPPQMSFGSSTFALQRLYPGHDSFVRTVLPGLVAGQKDRVATALATFEQVLAPANRQALSPAARRALFGEFHASFMARHRGEIPPFLNELAKLADDCDEELAHRYREQSVLLGSPVETSQALQRAVLAAERGDWPTAMRWFDRAPAATSSFAPHVALHATALYLAGRQDEGRKHLDQARARSLNAATDLKLAEALAKAGHVDRADALLGTAFPMIALGDDTCFHAAQTQGDLLESTSPTKAAQQWRFAQLGVGSPARGRSLAHSLQQICRLHLAEARGRLATGDAKASLAAAERAHRATPDNLDVATTLVPLFEKAGHADLADIIYRESYDQVAKLCKAFPSSSTYRERMARLAKECGRAP